jgi:type II secretory pathway component PulF
MKVQKYSKIKLKSKDRLSLITDLTTMLKSGISIMDAVVSLEKDARGNSKKILSRIRNGLYNGESLAKILEKFPRTFDQITVNLIRAAEAGGTLETTLQDIADTGKKEANFSEQLRNTMIYPFIVLVIFLAIIILVLTFVMPRVSKVFKSLNINMPLITRVMLAASTFFMAHWYEVIAGLIILIFLSAVLFVTHKRFIYRMFLALPMLHKLGRDIDYARFMRSFALLMRAGVPILDALKYAEPVVQKKEIALVVHQMRNDVANGKELAGSLASTHGVVPALMERSIKTAEETGTLEQALQNLADYFDDQVSSSLKVLGSVVEPVMIVFVGIMVGVLMISVIAPVYGMISQLNSPTSTTGGPPK